MDYDTMTRDELRREWWDRGLETRPGRTREELVEDMRRYDQVYYERSMTKDWVPLPEFHGEEGA